MKLTLTQPEVLVRIEITKGEISQIISAMDLNMPINQINQVIGELMQNELISDRGAGIYEVSLKGYEKLEPYKVKRAIFLAAGFGTEIVPITLNTPSP